MLKQRTGTINTEPVETKSGQPYRAGLEGIIAARTRLSRVDAAGGELIIAGFPLQEIAGRASFEEMVYLLWHDRLPNPQELDEFCSALAAQRGLPPATMDLLTAAARLGVPAMDALRVAADSLSLELAAEGNGPSTDTGVVVLSRLPTIVAAYWRTKNGHEPVTPSAELGHAANYLYMLSGEKPAPEQTRALETYFNAAIDHGLNASTFTARVIISTGSDLISAIAGAIGALKGPLHGGAPGPALDMVFEIGSADRAESYLRAKLERKERLMGFGHRVYRARDPRADVLGAAADRLYSGSGNRSLYDLAKNVEQTALALLAEYHPERPLQTNVEFYTALVLHGLGLPVELFTPTFTLTRAAGWIAHCEEQRRENRLIRPQSEYVGPTNRRWIPLQER